MCACVGRCKGAGRGGPSVCACGSHLRCYFSGAIPLGFALFCFEMRSLTGLEFTEQAGLAGWVESSRERPVLASPVLRSQAHATMLGFFSHTDSRDQRRVPGLASKSFANCAILSPLL